MAHLIHVSDCTCAAKSTVGGHTVSNEPFATFITISTVEFVGEWRVVFAFHPSDMLP